MPAMLRLRNVRAQVPDCSERSLATPPLPIRSIRNLYTVPRPRSKSALNTTPANPVAEYPVTEHPAAEDPLGEHPVAEHLVAGHAVPVLRNLVPHVTVDMFAKDESFTIQEIHHHNQRLAERDLNLQRVAYIQEWLKAIGIGLDNTLLELQSKLSKARLTTPPMVYSVLCGFFKDLGKTCDNLEYRWPQLVHWEQWADKQDECLRKVYGELLAAAEETLPGKLEIFSTQKRATQEENRQEHEEVMLQIGEGIYGFYTDDVGKASATDQEENSQEPQEVVMPINEGVHMLNTDDISKVSAKKKNRKRRRTVSIATAMADTVNKQTNQSQESMETTAATLDRNMNECKDDSVREQPTPSAEGTPETTKADPKSSEDAASGRETNRERRDTLTTEPTQGAEEAAKTTKADSESKKNMVNEQRVAGNRRDTLADTLGDVLNEAADELNIGRDQDHGTTPDQRITDAPETSHNRGEAAQLVDEGVLQPNTRQDDQQSIAAECPPDAVSDNRFRRESHDTLMDGLAHTDHETADEHDTGMAQTQSSIADREPVGDARENDTSTTTPDPEDVRQTSDSTEEPDRYTPSRSSASIDDTQRQADELCERQEDPENLASWAHPASSNSDTGRAKKLREWQDSPVYFPTFTDPNSIEYDQERTTKLWGRRTADVEGPIPRESGPSSTNKSECAITDDELDHDVQETYSSSAPICVSAGIPGTVLDNIV
jgi:hypothetical protein